ncbi:carboxylesterase family protein [Agromyces laixinhei]|uniref:carboxylesterase family protein n=1 Tax=Agromyces laixinhei TaxID=2585717 RepID=UPI0011168844|nr:carboxylesterase family protein [Agromyces laixinhei]
MSEANAADARDPGRESDPAERRFALGAGVVVGRVDDDVVRALGIPYAEAARFAAPVRVTRYEEPVHAFQRAPIAPQLPAKLFDRLIGDDVLAMDENCQRLSVTAPADLDDAERLPVLVWIHGGGNVVGAGDLAYYDPRTLVAEQRVIVVTVTYRLGMLGFLGDGADLAANLGLLDQLMALRWVRENISAFGGDPDSVTLFGQSSGADAIAHLMISDGADGLFRRVIMQSAPLGVTTGRAAMAEAMLSAVGALSRDADVEEILALQPVAERAARGFGQSSRMPFGVQSGFPPVPDEADHDPARRESARRVDVLIGSTMEETGVIAALLPALKGVFRLPVLGRLVRRLVVTPSTRSMYELPARRFVARHRIAGGRAYQYRMTWRPDRNGYGSAHLTDLPLLLGSRRAWASAALLGSADWGDVHRRGRIVRRIWAEFARTGRVPDVGENDTITLL